MACDSNPCDSMELDIQFVHDSIDHALAKKPMPPVQQRVRAKLTTPRWSISRENLYKLEAIFKKEPMPSSELRHQLAQEMGATPRQVRVWFRNRRQRTRINGMKNDLDDTPDDDVPPCDDNQLCSMPDAASRISSSTASPPRDVDDPGYVTRVSLASNPSKPISSPTPSLGSSVGTSPAVMAEAPAPAPTKIFGGVGTTQDLVELTSSVGANPHGMAQPPGPAPKIFGSFGTTQDLVEHTVQVLDHMLDASRKDAFYDVVQPEISVPSMDDAEPGNRVRREPHGAYMRADLGFFPFAFNRSYVHQMGPAPALPLSPIPVPPSPMAPLGEVVHGEAEAAIPTAKGAAYDMMMHHGPEVCWPHSGSPAAIPLGSLATLGSFGTTGTFANVKNLMEDWGSDSDVTFESDATPSSSVSDTGPITVSLTFDEDELRELLGDALSDSLSEASDATSGETGR